MVPKCRALWAVIGLICVTEAVELMSMVEMRARRTTIKRNHVLHTDATESQKSPPLLYPAYNLTVPIDHFHNDTLYEPHSTEYFNLRYFFDATYYQSGGPVIVLQSGETSAVGRLPFLQKGLLHDLAVATHGIGVVLEHRYYGSSIPTPDLSTKNLRFLTTDQALADQAYFAKNVVFAGLEDQNLTAPNVPYLAYGGSYAGAFVAFLRKLYPDIYWGAISSSGVTAAIWDYWQYFEPIRIYAPAKCISITQKIINVVDNIILVKNDTRTTTHLKTAWGLPNVTHDDDFASLLSLGLERWQGRNWDPEISQPWFDNFCGDITANDIINPEVGSLRSTVQHLLKEGGYGSEVKSLTTPMLNWIAWMQQNVIRYCPGDQDTCFGSRRPDFYSQDDISQDWRLWPYQYCTQWGYLQTGNTPPATLPLVSRTNTLAYSSIICNLAFNITSPPNVTAINQYGGFALSYPRLAIVDGEQDPWRPATPHASPFMEGVLNRTSTVSEPFLLIKGAVHHWDENGLFPNQTREGLLPPKPVREVQRQEIEFVKAWIREWEITRETEVERGEL